MSKRKNHSLAKRFVIDVAGFGLIISSLFLGWLPGPGGIPMFLAGLGILSLNYDWAENLLKDFDRRRIEFTEKYLVGNKKVARTIDILCFLIIFMAAVVLAFTSNKFIFFGAIGAASFSLFVLVSNQRRLDRLIKRLKKIHKH